MTNLFSFLTNIKWVITKNYFLRSYTLYWHNKFVLDNKDLSSPKFISYIFWKERRKRPPVECQSYLRHTKTNSTDPVISQRNLERLYSSIIFHQSTTNIIVIKFRSELMVMMRDGNTNDEWIVVHYKFFWLDYFQGSQVACLRSDLSCPRSRCVDSIIQTL
jgi:hypothetical protein